MSQERVTVSLDDDAKDALDDLVKRTQNGKSAVVRDALEFYAANYDVAASIEKDRNLTDYHQMLSEGEHVLLDIDFFHAFLRNIDLDDPDDGFMESVDRVSEYHAKEYAERFDNIEELLNWLSICGFLSVRNLEGTTYHVVFPSEEMRWFMTRFIRKSTTDLSFEVEVEESVSKVLIKQTD
jgi:Arc/MetJ-type ribon-helix-helix transcriptional regulator